MLLPSRNRPATLLRANAPGRPEGLLASRVGVTKAAANSALATASSRADPHDPAKARHEGLADGAADLVGLRGVDVGRQLDGGELAALVQHLRDDVSKAQAISKPNIAIASSPATRDTALLTPDAVPAASAPTAFITVVVSGATVTDMPRPIGRR